MSQNFYKKLVSELMYGEDCVVLDNDTISEFVHWKKYVIESSSKSGISGISDEGLYDFFIGFDDYKRVTDNKAKAILGWPIVNYILSNTADDPFYELSMFTAPEKENRGIGARADSVSYGGAINIGTANPDAKYIKELEKITSSLGWQIVKWLGVGPNRKSKVLVIPTSQIKENFEKPHIKIKVLYTEAPRKPRKKGQHRNSPNHSDLYTDENPKGTIKGLKFATVSDAKASVNKIKNSSKSHAHKIQAAVAMEQRAKEMGKTSQAAVYRAYINKMKEKTKKKNEEFGAPPGMLPSPSRKGVKKAKDRKDRSVYSEQENNIKKLVAVYPGRYQPFGPHHLESYKFLKKRFDEVYVVTSDKTGGARHPMNFAQKKKHMMRMGVPSKAIAKERQPYIPKGLLSKYDGDTTAVVFAVGEKDEGRLTSGKYFKPYRKNYNNLKGFKDHGYTLQIPHTSIKVGGMEISGTTMRKLMGSDKFDVDKKKKFFKKLFGYFDKKTFDLFTTSFKEEIKLDVSVGDTIAVGKFKNKKIKVKSIGKDDHGMPTINGRKIVNFRKINEGGAYGHMAHPFDDFGLTFGELKDIIDMGLQGKLDKEEEVTEKLDGQNIMISCIKGKAVAARNKGDLKRGGMSLKGVKLKFANHLKSVKDAFVFSMKDIASSVERMSKSDQEKLFNNGMNWANIEIIYPENKNVIDYDGPATIVFHGILEYNEAWTPSGEVKSGGKKLADIINKVNGKIKTRFAFKGPNIIKMHKVKDYTKQRSKYIGALNKLQDIYRLKDSDTLSLWHQHFWLEYIMNGANSSDYPNIPDNVTYPLMKRWAFSDKSYKMTEINKLKDEYPKFVEWVRATEKEDHAKMLKDNMAPFEQIFFGVGAEILANASNYLSVNPSKTAQKLRSDFEDASKKLSSKKDFSNADKFKAQLKKLKKLPSLSKIAPTEGLVFKYKGKVFKFTGFFAPINQILGLEKFSR